MIYTKNTGRSHTQSLLSQGFTLIELLVVVLIIGILAAVAVPQYQKAMEKSKAVEALSLLKTLQQTYDTYYLANGTYPTNWEQLDVQISWTGNEKYINVSYDPSKSNEDWAVQLHHGGSWKGISIGRISGPYQGAGFIYLYQCGEATDVPLHQILCVESRNSSKPFNKQPGDYCQKIFNAPSRPQTHMEKYFTLP